MNETLAKVALQAALEPFLVEDTRETHSPFTLLVMGAELALAAPEFWTQTLKDCGQDLGDGETDQVAAILQDRYERLRGMVQEGER